MFSRKIEAGMEVNCSEFIKWIVSVNLFWTFSVTKIKEETGVQIIIPNEVTNSDEIKVEGKKEGVKKAIEEITEIVKRIVSFLYYYYMERTLFCILEIKLITVARITFRKMRSQGTS